MAIKDYPQLARDIIAAIGGKENVASVTHCVTRVRFFLNDESKANDAEVKKLKGVLQVVHAGGQYQIVIGAEVNNVYEAILKEGGFKGGGEVSAKEQDALVKKAKEAKNKDTVLNRLLGTVSAIFAPVLGVLTAAGMIKALLVFLTLIGALSKESGVYIILNAVGDAPLYFFPVMLGWSAAKKFGLKEVYGIVIGAAMVYPTLIAADGEALYTLFTGTFMEAGVQLTFLGIPVLLRNYSNTVVPIILVIWATKYICDGIDKIMPAMLKAFFVPFLTLLISLPLALIVVGPIAMVLQNLISEFVQLLISLNAGIAGLVLGSIWSVLVMFGLHWAVIPFFAINVATYGYDIINPLIYSGAFASMGSVIGVIIREKSLDERSIEIPALISTFFGVNEPTLYGVLIPRKKVMLTCFLSAGIGGAIAGFSGAKLWAFGASGIFGTPCFINPAGIDGGFIGLLVGAAAAFVIALAMAMLIGAKRDDA
ncbi:PTS beta-glucoside transporter subunit EIIBCA [Enterocloster clostridioformis]|uniref:PTS transporter subunit EIIC n=1 Tax=Enterocloster clostridioformis TaxID=1531 RepID=UPI00080C6BF4|nr:PTS transporter subunit EIIC [Enterocloster clostridioformis]ANU46154.1 PTS beta-glucoside transporter subunit EIIBCA [Lachnoclostridium sp. YL32]NDO29977.1 PTS beta-glucoside transporter subunit EIIBCA [Enterocloster clostridioformis]OXE67351.1 PTS beta-glucoside transporter subunit EIIBCA [Enterocloster clostridioformis]QQQ99103.1 PTS transporter subunit EIIC [Enterocloster clostridioformis]